MNNALSKKTINAQVCVVGGGMAGLCAAVAAARNGAKTVLIQDRPVLGGNASSEIRMWIRGASGLENRETGLLQEIEMENIYRNPTMNYSLWDSVLEQFVLQEKNLTVVMNCSVLDCEMEESKIISVTGWQLTTYTFVKVMADIFIDCSGDSILAPLSNASYRVGREAASEMQEYATVQVADSHTMGNSILIEAKETDHSVSFIPPEWAHKYPTDESMYLKNHDIIGTGINFWWMELGGLGDTIADAENLRIELLKTAFGVWDHIKNTGDHHMENWELEWVGFLPGKRESRRYEGDYMLSQHDLESGMLFDDVVAFGGWTMDNHAPEGMKYVGYSSHHIKPTVPYQIPYRSLYSKNVDNLYFAGRNISASHMAMSSTRVMATCAVIGQAVGTAAAMAVKEKCTPRQIGQERIQQLQQILLEDGCYLPGHVRLIPEEMVSVDLLMGQAEKQILQNGWERPHNGTENKIILEEGSVITLRLRQPGYNMALRICLDPDFSRESISDCEKFKKFTMRAHSSLNESPVKMPAVLARELQINCLTENGEALHLHINDNRKVLLKEPLPDGVVRVEVKLMKAWKGTKIGVFSCDLSACR